MRFQDFVDAMHKAGWRSINDAQHDGIRKLWRELFPVIARLEDDLNEIKEDCL